MLSYQTTQARQLKHRTQNTHIKNLNKINTQNRRIKVAEDNIRRKKLGTRKKIRKKIEQNQKDIFKPICCTL